MSSTINTARGFSQGSAFGNPRQRALDLAIFRTRAPVGLLLGYLDTVRGRLPSDWYCAGYGLDRQPLRLKVQYPVTNATLVEPGTSINSPIVGGASISYLYSSDADGDSGNVGCPTLWWFDRPDIWEVNGIFTGPV